MAHSLEKKTALQAGKNAEPGIYLLSASRCQLHIIIPLSKSCASRRRHRGPLRGEEAGQAEPDVDEARQSQPMGLVNPLTGSDASAREIILGQHLRFFPGG